MSHIDELLTEVERLRKLAGLVTVRQVIDAGDQAIDAAGLNPWCINEGLATGEERLNLSCTDELIARIKEMGIR
jgi:hypothetical protein